MASRTASRRRKIRNHFGRTVLTVLFVVGMVVLSQGAPAGAVGLTHRVTTSSMTNLSLTVAKPSISFSCNDATGKWTFKITNVQVIKSDHVTTWEAPFAVAWLAFPLSPQVVTLTQNTTNGLYIGKSSGVADPAACATGNDIQVASWAPSVAWTDFQMLFDGTMS